MCCRPWGPKESDTTEWLTLFLSLKTKKSFINWGFTLRACDTSWNEESVVEEHWLFIFILFYFFFSTELVKRPWQCTCFHASPQLFHPLLSNPVPGPWVCSLCLHLHRCPANTRHHVRNRQPVGICSMIQGTQTGALWLPRGVGWGGRWEGGSRGRAHMYTYGRFMLMYGRTSTYFKAIILQLGKKKRLCWWTCSANDWSLSLPRTGLPW